MQIILVRNYLPDKQESMKRFGDMLELGFEKAGIGVISWFPMVFFGRLMTTTHGIGKWLGYIDKWVLFPFVIRYKLMRDTSRKPDTYYHICDHSNAMYLKHLPEEKAGITCHDVLAIRGALGFADAYTPASPFGKILQKWILKNLIQARKLACVSHLTYCQLNELVPSADLSKKKWVVIHNAFNANFRPMAAEDSRPLLANVQVDVSVPFILHVGSALPRKNRNMLVNMMVTLGKRWSGNICFAGQAIDDKLKNYIAEKGLSERVVSVLKPDHATLVALYSSCQAFVFPSFSEGFGWPVIEAQACGAPVIASNIEPMPEVSGGAAFHANPHRAADFADALLSLQDTELRKQLINKGFENVCKFTLPLMIQKYLELYSTEPVVSYVS